MRLDFFKGIAVVITLIFVGVSCNRIEINKTESSYELRHQPYGVYCEIQDGALAGEQEMTYRFNFKNGKQYIYGQGERIIDLNERDFFVFSVLSKSMKSGDIRLCPLVTFNCVEYENGKSLGVVGVNDAFDISELQDENKMVEHVLKNYIGQILTALQGRCNYVDQLPENRNIFHPEANLNTRLNFEETGETLAVSRVFYHKVHQAEYIDSIPFSTLGKGKKEISHEIVAYHDDSLYLTRYNNELDTIVYVVFARDLRFKGIQKEFESKGCYNWSGDAPVDLMKYTRPLEGVQQEIEFF